MSATDMFWAAPPITRTLAASAFVLSILCYTGTLSFGWVYFTPPATFLKLPPQLWRLVTSFLITSPKLGILFDTYFLYTYGSKLEMASPRLSQPGDFFTYLLFVGTTIIGLNYFITGAGIFTSALILAFAYTACQDEKGQKATFYVVTVPAPWVPWIMLLVTYVSDGPGAAKVQFTGMVAAHLHDFLTRLWPEFGGGFNLVPTPGFIRRLWQTTEPSVKDRRYGTAFAPAQRDAGNASGSASAPVLPESWRSRGSGHRLGGE